ncbi:MULTISPECIES: META domain-containing protein [unclassified Streptomyces]|uniref:META domain-containing protein n=1 Tax=unclassified Streptomyces TaxID=2593676 RepID=UPI000363B0B6|nr:MULTISPECIES: META domain-containing protein [unclassified Streptomyces]MYY05150.1 META domain-containing protein [Streptomyces sp. SID4913]
MQLSTQPSTRRRHLAVGLLALLALTACGTESADGTGAGSSRAAPAGDSGSAQPAESLTGVRWNVDALTVDGRRTKAPAGAHLEIDTKGRAGGSYGCNRFTAQVRLDGDTLTVEQGLTTEMGCEPAVQRFESLLAGAFKGRLTATVKDKTVTLTTAKGDTITLTASRPVPLAGTDWRVTTLASGSTASSVPSGTEGGARITFGRDGTVHGTLGCNTFRATAEVSGSTITFGPLTATRKTCPDPDMRLESAVREVLDGTRTTFAIDQRTLTLTTQGGDKGIGASAAEENG